MVITGTVCANLDPVWDLFSALLHAPTIQRGNPSIQRGTPLSRWNPLGEKDTCCLHDVLHAMLVLPHAMIDPDGLIIPWVGLQDSVWWPKYRIHDAEVWVKHLYNPQVCGYLKAKSRDNYEWVVIFWAVIFWAHNSHFVIYHSSHPLAKLTWLATNSKKSIESTNHVLWGWCNVI